MNDRLVIIGLIVCAILVLIPIAMVGRLIWGIISFYRDHRFAEARKVTAIVPRLGAFSSTDERLWFGEIGGVQVTLDSPRGPPSNTQATQVLTLLENLPQLVDRAKHFIVEHEDTSRLTGGVDKFDVYGIEPESDEAFVLEMIHPADFDGVYRIEFRGGLPVSSGRDD